MLRTKSWLKWIQEQGEGQEVKIVGLDNAFEEFCSTDVREIRQVVIEA